MLEGVMWGPAPEDSTPTRVPGLYARNGSGYPPAGDESFEAMWRVASEGICEHFGTRDEVPTTRIETYEVNEDSGVTSVEVREWIAGFGYSAVWTKTNEIGAEWEDDQGIYEEED